MMAQMICMPVHDTGRVSAERGPISSTEHTRADQIKQWNNINLYGRLTRSILLKLLNIYLCSPAPEGMGAEISVSAVADIRYRVGRGSGRIKSSAAAAGLVQLVEIIEDGLIDAIHPYFQRISDIQGSL